MKYAVDKIENNIALLEDINTKETITRILFMALCYDLCWQNYFNNPERNATFVPIYLYNLMIYRSWSR